MASDARPSLIEDGNIGCDRAACDKPATGYDAWGQWCDDHSGGLAETPRPPISRLCGACDVTSGAVDDGLVIVGPDGLAHFGDGGDTHCGIDATGADWWWPL